MNAFVNGRYYATIWGLRHLEGARGELKARTCLLWGSGSMKESGGIGTLGTDIFPPGHHDVSGS